MPFEQDFNAIDAQRRARLAKLQGGGPLQGSGPGLFGDRQPQEQEEPGLLDYATDLAFAGARGIEGAVQDVYGLADALTGDALPDYDQRVFGESKTAVGGLLEGVVNFATGFVPVVGWVGKGAKIGRSISLAKGLSKTAQAGRATRAGRVATGLARDATAGAIADFAVFDGHEERLSNLVERFPGLSNPITEYLAADEDDGELEGRFKNAVEGLGLGAFVDALTLGVKGVRAGRRARQAGGSPQAVQDAMDAAASPQAVKEAVERAQDAATGRVKETDALTPDGAKEAAGELQAQAEFQGPKSENHAGARETASDAAGSTRAQDDPEVQLGREGAQESAGTPRDRLIALGLDEADAEDVLRDLDSREADGVDPSGNPRRLTPAERLANRLQERDLNLSAFEGPEGALQLVRTVEDLSRDVAAREVPGIARETLDEIQTRSLAELTDLVGASNPQTFMANVQRGLGEDLASLREVNARVQMYKTILQGHADETFKKIRSAASQGGNTDAALLESARNLEDLANLTAGVKGLLSEQGRGLVSNRIPVRSLVETGDNEAISQLIQQAGGRDHLVKTMRQAQAAFEGSGASGLTKFARGAFGQKAFGVLNEYWINSLLSGPKTQVVNLMSGLAASVYRPFESMLGGALTLNADVVADSMRELVGLVTAFPEALKLGKAAALGGDNILDPAARVVDVPQAQRGAITPENLGIDPDSVQGAAMGWLGKIIRMPTQLLQGTDEFVKQLNYRATARASLTREGVKKGLSGDDLGEFVAGEMDRIIHDGQALSNQQLLRRGLAEAQQRGITGQAQQAAFAEQFAREQAARPEFEQLSALSKTALDRAEEVTFTRALPEGTLGHTIQQAVNRHPALRLVMPFVRTPINIAKFAGQRFDAVGLAQVVAAKRFPKTAKNLEASQRRLVADALSGDPRKVADATGRLAAGAMFASFGMMAGLSGTITGRGPKDPDQRRILEEAGWQPYSFRTDKGYVSYARLDPFATLLGTFADIADFARWSSDEDQGSVEEAALGLAVGLANNFTNKTYLQGLNEVVNALEDPARHAERTIARYAGSFVPAAVQQGLVQTSDPILRDVQGITDAFLNRVPGFSDDLAPVRNVFGEPVRRIESAGADTIGKVANGFLPIAYREVSDDVVQRELAALSYGFSPPRKKRHGQDLTEMRLESGQSAYDRWSQLHGEVKIGGQTMRQAMRRLFKSAEYKRLPAVSDGDEDNPRAALVNNLIRDYRRQAWRQLLREAPEVNTWEREQMRGARQRSTDSATGNDRVRTLLGRSVQNPFQSEIQ